MPTVPDTTPLLEIVFGLMMLIAIILVHGVGLRAINRRHSRRWSRVNAHTAHWRIDLLLAQVIGSFAALHLLETLLFAVPLTLSGIIPQLRDSYYYVLESYTTLGESTLQLPKQWRLFGPIIAMSGLFTFGWTGSSLVNVMTQFARLDQTQADRGAKSRGEHPDA